MATGEGSQLGSIDAKPPKRREQTGLVTRVVYAVNDEC